MAHAFVYGTLMHPQILRRVIGNEGEHLKITPAVLLDYTRHHVKLVTYPGILPWEQSKALFDKELGREEKSVRGSLIVGLTDLDVKFLDTFEGDEYVRATVQVHPLAELVPLPSYTLESTGRELVPTTISPLPIELPAAVCAQVYIYGDICRLDETKGLWSFEDFVKTNAKQWYGDAANDREDIIQVDRVRERLANTSVSAV